MPHEDFFEATLIEFTNWQKGEEKLVARFLRFEDLPPDLIEHLENSFESKISLQNFP